MEWQRDRERRQYARYPANFLVSFQEPSSPGISPAGAPIIRGDLQNISRGGFCLASNHACKESSFLRCEFFIPGFSVGVPTLAQVRWIRQNAPEEFLAGLQFLLE
jgi:hypothetical protein